MRSIALALQVAGHLSRAAELAAEAEQWFAVPGPGALGLAFRLSSDACWHRQQALTLTIGATAEPFQ